LQFQRHGPRPPRSWVTRCWRGRGDEVATRAAWVRLGRGLSHAAAGQGRRGSHRLAARVYTAVMKAEPAQAWSPAWDMIAADPCNGFKPG